MELIFAYGAGLLTLINPCVLPVLPIVLGSALQADRRGPLALAAGMSISFVTFGMIVASAGHAIGLTEEGLARIGATLMILFGAVLLIPALNRGFETVTAGFATTADQRMGGMDLGGLRGQFLGGMLLGAVWSPCIGPTLGGAIALASQGESLVWAFLIMVAFALGVSTLILGLGLGAREVIRSRARSLRGLAERSKPLLGGLFVAVGLMILFGIHKMIDAWAIRTLPYWLQDLSIAL
ncbi:MAG: cytochrome c biogenesis CcdA family protein [Pseudomonadota bacterium]